ncbi:MAG: diguanylate cyclase [Candidatus Hydrogenedentes bacterium]|nr:diguanylate cyclase [Candidatus Hydrogenedentota bacterium]
MDWLEIALVILFVLGMGIVIALWVWIWKRLNQAVGGSVVNQNLTSTVSFPENIRAEVSELERTKMTIHGLLKNLESQVQSMLLETGKYENNLDEHSAQLKRSQTLATLQQIEQVLLDEVEKMKMSTIVYKKELDEAQVKIKEQEQVLEKLSKDASTDFLTQVYNRGAFDRKIVEEFARYKRYGHIFSLVLFDLDHFKDVNDTYGHLVGDRVLRAIALLISEEKRVADFLARYGGEEFALILPGINIETAKNVAEKFRKKLEGTTFKFEGYSINLTVSAGIAEVLPTDQLPSDVIKRSDEALYEAKSKGRNQVVAK